MILKNSSGISLIVAALLLVTSNNVGAAKQPGISSVQQSAEEGRIARLVGLAKVWSAVKYFHPFLAYHEINWDKALVESIPKVNAAETPEEYSAAINAMLAVLADGNTRAEIESEPKAEPKTNQPSAKKSEHVKL